MGKTPLVEMFLAEVSASGRLGQTARGRCSERLAGTEAYLPLLEALHSLLHGVAGEAVVRTMKRTDRKSTRLNSSHDQISYAVFCLKKKNKRLLPPTHSFPEAHA